MTKIDNNQHHVIWLIDEKERELKTHYNILRRIMPSSIEVKPIKPFRHIDEFISLLEDLETVCIITDQRLKDTGIATYTGIDLARFIRGINSKIPVYILTNYADDHDQFAGSEWSVEDIIKKSEMNTEDGQKILKARILRRINVYQDILDEKAERLNLLIKKSLEGKLKRSELQELEELRLENLSPTLAKELAQIRQIDQIISSQEKLMNHLNQLTSMEKDNGL